MAQPALNQLNHVPGRDDRVSPQRAPITASRRLLLIVDDDVFRLRLTGEAQEAGFDIRNAATAAEAILSCRADWSPDAIVLDQLMPRSERYASIRALRAAFGVPMLVVSNEPLAADSTLERGVILLSRNAIVSEARHLDAFGEGAPLILTVGPLLLDRRTGIARIHLRDLNLTQDEATTLAALMMHPGEIVTRRALIATVGGMQRDLDPRIIDVHVIRLMVKLGATAPLTIERSADREGYALHLLTR